MSDMVRIARRGAVLDITLDRPQENNVLSAGMASAIVLALEEIGPDVKLVRLQASGADFCLGREPPAVDRSIHTAHQYRALVAEGPLRLYAAVRECRAPVLGVLQGRSAGVGCALAGLCDVAVAAEDAVFSIPEMDHGTPPMLVMSALIDRIPYQALSYLVLSRADIPASEAKALGLVSRTVATPVLYDEARALETAMLACDVGALRGVKEYMRSASGQDPATRTTLASSLIATVLASQT